MSRHNNSIDHKLVHLIPNLSANRIFYLCIDFSNFSFMFKALLFEWLINKSKGIFLARFSREMFCKCLQIAISLCFGIEERRLAQHRLNVFCKYITQEQECAFTSLGIKWTQCFETINHEAHGVEVINIYDHTIWLYNEDQHWVGECNSRYIVSLFLRFTILTIIFEAIILMDNTRALLVSALSHLFYVSLGLYHLLDDTLKRCSDTFEIFLRRMS